MNNSLPRLLAQLYPDLPEDTVFIETVNNPALLPFGGEVVLEKRIVDDNGKRRFFYVGRVSFGREYVFYCEDC